MTLMAGLTRSSLKKHKSLMPLFFFLGLGGVGAAVYLARLGLRSPDVSWSHKRKLNEYQAQLPANYQHKFFSPSIDYKTLKAHPDRPDI